MKAGLITTSRKKHGENQRTGVRDQMTLTKKCNLYPRKVRPSLAGREEREERQNTENLFRLPKKTIAKYQIPTAKSSQKSNFLSQSREERKEQNISHRATEDTERLVLKKCAGGISCKTKRAYSCSSSLLAPRAHALSQLRWLF